VPRPLQQGFAAMFSIRAAMHAAIALSKKSAALLHAAILNLTRYKKLNPLELVWDILQKLV